MPRVRPRKPAEKKIQAGTYRPHRDARLAGAAYVVLMEPPAPPEQLDGHHAHRLWQELAAKLVASGTLTAGDLPALELLCANHEVRKGCEAVLAHEGLTTRGARGQTAAHPMLAARKAAAAEEAALLKAFGLTPATRLGTPGKEEPRNESPFSKRKES